MKQTIRLNEADLHRIVRESIKGVLNEEYGVDFEDTLKWVQKKKPNMSPQEQERFANNIINKKRSETNVQSGTYEGLTPQDADEWWIIHIYYGYTGNKEQHYTVFSEDEARKIINDWGKWASKKRTGFDYEAYHVENPSHSDDRDDWFYSHWSV